MAIVVGIRFKKAGKIYYFDPGALELAENDLVIVETARGTEAGHVVLGRKEVSEEEITQPLKMVLRKATDEDERQIEANRQKEASAFDICAKKIAEHQLPMKLIDVEYTFDNTKVIFYFTSEGRVDFRELVKDLAAIFKTRIELHQIGVRDEAKMIGGLGPCGRSMCCTTFLGDFEPVSIKMAKEQNLSLNPAKISGICGRLMCCLKFERDLYREAKEESKQEAEECECRDVCQKEKGQPVEKEDTKVTAEETAKEDAAKQPKSNKKSKKRRRSKNKKRKANKNRANQNGTQKQQ
ncbi:MAG: stage 0 sporulation family protein [Limnochordia bacterium]|jgi:cell fate regulator YaaT (PSP1 superfamily)|nr:stage 0 sporulation family protein [Limnochordia bacterium]MDD2756513.1 stage 0 sporulation family protein [Methanothrix sp.]MDD4517804.1 stage 0 sporulation family protein [Limnochordia bacterium]